MDQQNITIVIEETVVLQDKDATDPNTKKRGRKPKGGKLIIKPSIKADSPPPVTNIILHLKCSTQDLNEHNNVISQLVSDPLTYNPNIPPSIMTYNSTESSFSVYDKNNDQTIQESVSNENTSVENKSLAYNEMNSANGPIASICKLCSEKIEKPEEPNIDDDAGISLKDINAKLKKIKMQLYKGTNLDKKAACFWCTYDYDNPSCYIPKYEMDGQLHGYGSFCRPECAVAFLMEENIDDSSKFERYHLLNQLYSKVYEYKKNIKPAPNPYYLLEKYYGNLTIQEYRKLLKTEHMLLVIDKPMTRILPELHEDNEDFVTNIYGGKTAQSSQNGVYKVKRQSEKQQGPSKSTIMKESFGLGEPQVPPKTPSLRR